MNMKSKLSDDIAHSDISSLEWISGNTDSTAQALLNQSIREQLKRLANADKTIGQRRDALQKSFIDVVEPILGIVEVSYGKLYKRHEAAYEQAMLSMTEAKLSESELTTQYIHHRGLVLSPLNCSRTIRDINRLDFYIKSLHKLVADLLKSRTQIHLVYPACGPFAPLLMPLLTFYSKQQLVAPDQLRVTLIDIQSGAVKTLQQLAEDLGVSGYIDSIVEGDASTYAPKQAFDILLLEASHHGFSREAHLMLARQLLPHLKPSGVMLPCEISVKAALVIGQQEFVEQWREQSAAEPIELDDVIIKQRVELGEVASLDRYSMLSTDILTLPDGQELAKCNTLPLPENCSDIAQRLLVIYSEFKGYDGVSLGQYQSGISHPLPIPSVCIDFIPRSPMPDDLLLQNGDHIEFFYRLTGSTGFVPMKA